MAHRKLGLAYSRSKEQVAGGIWERVTDVTRACIYHQSGFCGDFMVPRAVACSHATTYVCITVSIQMVSTLGPAVESFETMARTHWTNPKG